MRRMMPRSSGIDTDVSKAVLQRPPGLALSES